MPVHASLEDYETFTWRSYRFEVVPAKGQYPRLLHADRPGSTDGRWRSSAT